VLCRIHHLVRHVTAIECARCGDRVDTDDSVAIDIVTEAIACADGDIRKVTLNDVSQFDLCDACEDGVEWRD
jgi:hypothetical protein